MRGLRRARRRRPAAARGVAGLRGMPRRLAVVAERRAAPRRQARQLRTRRAARRYHRETTSYKKYIIIIIFKTRRPMWMHLCVCICIQMFWQMNDLI